MEIELRPRGHSANGIPTWHDYAAVLNALEFVTRGVPFIKCGVWIDIARRIELARDGADGNRNATMTIELDDASARRLVVELQNLPPEAFARNIVTGQAKPAPLVPWSLMMTDLAEQTGVKLTMED